MLNEVIERGLKNLGGHLASVKVERQRISRRDSQDTLPDQKKLVLLLSQVTFENPLLKMLYEHLHCLDRAQQQAKDQLIQRVVDLRVGIEGLKSEVATLKSDLQDMMNEGHQKLENPCQNS